MDEYTQVLERIDKGCFTIGDLASEFKEFPQEELEETLDGFVLFKKISKTRQYYHGNNIIPPEKKTRQFTGNSLDMTQVDYPDWVKSDRDKVKYITSPECPKLSSSRHFFIDDIDLKETGKVLYDSLNSNHIMTSVFISPNRGDVPGNKIDYSKDVTQYRGFSMRIQDGVFKVNVSLLKSLQPRYANGKEEAVADHHVKEFKTYAEFKQWILENL